jgi:hypothetical protein
MHIKQVSQLLIATQALKYYILDLSAEAAGGKCAQASGEPCLY